LIVTISKIAYQLEKELRSNQVYRIHRAKSVRQGVSSARSQFGEKSVRQEVSSARSRFGRRYGSLQGARGDCDFGLQGEVVQGLPIQPHTDGHVPKVGPG